LPSEILKAELPESDTLGLLGMADGSFLPKSFAFGLLGLEDL